MVSDGANSEQLPIQWVVADEHYGMNPEFLDGIDALGKCYFVAVPKNTMVWPEDVKITPSGKGPMGAPRKGPRVASGARAHEVRQIGAQLSTAEARSGTRGLGYLSPWSGARGRDQILLEQCAGSMSAHRAGANERRWPIETTLEEGRSELGMDHYETRTWRDWRHQMTPNILAHHFLFWRTSLRIIRSASGSNDSVSSYVFL
jgi:SRSO17 transposase